MDGEADGLLKPYREPGAIRSELARRSFRFKRRLGQNFLVNKAVLDFVVSEGAVSPGDLVLEIGAGPGCLTGTLLERGARVISVEIDRALSEAGQALVLAGAAEEARNRIQWITGDFLAGKNRINPEVEDVLRHALSSHGQKNFKVLSNLPYCIATPAIVNLLESGLPWDRMVVTVQEEVADRFLARPGTSAYGQVSVLAAASARIRRLKKLKAGNFWPRPEVDSAVLELLPVAAPAAMAGLPYGVFKEFVRNIFAHRRKTWMRSLKTCYKTLDLDGFIRAVDPADLRTDARAQDLGMEEIIELSRLFACHALETGSNGIKPKKRL